MAIPRGTTPTFQLKITNDDVDLTQASNVYVSFTQLGLKLEKSGDDIVVAAKQVDVYLSQEETLQFEEGTVEVQINYTYGDGSRAATKIKKISISKNLIGRVLE